MRTILLLASCGWVSFAAAQTWTIEASLGNAYNLRAPLKVEQDGGYSRSLTASYETRGFEAPPHYLLRASRWNGESAWELSFIHHKIYLENPPDGVSSLSVSHGFNIATLNRAYRSGNWMVRFGAGPVITHAEAAINGTRYDGPYQLSGFAALAGGGYRHYFRQKTFVSLEGAVTAAYARPKMNGPPDARLSITNIALHGFLGIGQEF
ncbi:MAG: hypothetical protein ACKVQT_08460 [Burkholderiales bacterium]